MSRLFWSLFFFFFFCVNSAGCSGEFHRVSKHFQNIENLIFKNFEEKIAYPLIDLRALFS